MKKTTAIALLLTLAVMPVAFADGAASYKAKCAMCHGPDGAGQTTMGKNMKLRALIKEADPKVAEEWKWGTPVWSHNGIICTGETYKKVVKMTFAKGAFLKDPAGLFNSSLEGKVRRAIDFHEGDKVDEKALKALIRAAVALNGSAARS